MTVSHHGLNGIGNKIMSNHLRHNQPFGEGGGSSPLVFAGISIIEVVAALKKGAESQSITT
jgi:hypothetical protein